MVRHKIIYTNKKGTEESMLNVKYTDLRPTLELLYNDNNIKDISIQEYPLKNNHIRLIKKDGKDIYEKIDRQHIVSFSGGKDSTAMLIRMLELGMRVDRVVFADTKYEFEEMYEYINMVETYIQNNFNSDIVIERVSTEDELEDWIFGKITRGKREGEIRGFPLTAFPCYWSREAKVSQLDKAMRGQYRYIGIAIDEKSRQSKKAKDALYIYPLIDWGWTEQDCMRYLESKDLVNVLYTEEVTRTGCWWCPKQSLGAWRSLYKNHRDKFNQVTAWEDQLGRPITPNYSTKDLASRFEKE